MMANLLDNPNDVGMLSLGLRLLSTPGKFGQALGTAGLGAMGDMQQQKQAQAMAQQQAMQQEMQRMQIDQIKRQQAEQEQQRQRQMAVEGAYRGAMESPAQQALAAGGGPTVGNAQAMQGMAPRINQQKLIEQLMQADPMMAAKMLEPAAPMKIGKDDRLIDPKTRKVLLDAMPDKQNLSDLIIPGPDGRPMVNQLALDAKRAIAMAGKTSLNVSVDAGPKAFWSDYGKNAADALFKERESAQSAANIAQSVQQIRQAVKGGAYQGTGAELKLGAAKALGALGMPYDANTVANTEVFQATAGKFVLDNIKALGVNPSNADRVFIEKTVPRLQTDPAALPALLQFMEGKAHAQIQAYNSKASSVAKKPGGQFLPFDLGVQAPGGVVDFGSLK